MKDQIHILDAIQNLDKWFMQRNVQLFLKIRNQKVKAEASAFLLNIFDLYLLITAGHVLENGNYNNLCFPNKSNLGMSSIEGIWYSSDKNENVGHDIDDFAYIILNQSLKELFLNNDYKFIGIENIDLNHIPNESEIYTANGFRWRKTEADGHDHYSRFDIITNFGAHKSKYKSPQANQNTILIKNNKKLIRSTTGEKVLTGRLDGMSGGSIWHTGLAHNYFPEKPDIKLVGILNTYEFEVIQGCNINKLVNVLFQRQQIDEYKFLKYLNAKQK